MEGDFKEIIGALMRVLGGGTISRAEVEDLTFDASCALQVALIEAYITLLEFAHDCEAGSQDQARAEHMRVELQRRLDNIVRCSDATA
jgi:hypothetical protein